MKMENGRFEQHQLFTLSHDTFSCCSLLVEYASTSYLTHLTPRKISSYLFLTFRLSDNVYFHQMCLQASETLLKEFNVMSCYFWINCRLLLVAEAKDASWAQIPWGGKSHHRITLIVLIDSNLNLLFLNFNYLQYHAIRRQPLNSYVINRQIFKCLRDLKRF